MVISINGIHCEACVITIEEALNNINGVQKAQVSLIDKIATVDGNVSIEDVLSKLKLIGYEGALKKNNTIKNPSKLTRDRADIVRLAPLFIILALLATLAFAKNYKDFNTANFMLDYMGLFYIVFSIFKFIDYKSFPKLFVKYDPIANRYPFYGWVYPFIELGLGAAFIFRFQLLSSLALSLITIGFTTIGVFNKLRQHSKIQCACLGTMLDLPLTKATLIENTIMISMALWMLIF